MLSENDIQQVLHARRVVPLPGIDPHGPLGLERLAATVARLADTPAMLPGQSCIRRPIALSVETWEKLEHLAQSTAQASAHSVTASEVASAIIEQFVATTSASTG